MESTQLIAELVAQFVRKVDQIPLIVSECDPYDGIPKVGKNESRLIHPLDDDLERMYLLSNYSARAAGVCKSLNKQADYYDFVQVSNILMATFWSLARDRYDLKEIGRTEVRVHAESLCLVLIDIEAVAREGLFLLTDLMSEYEKHRAAKQEKKPEPSRGESGNGKGWLN